MLYDFGNLEMVIRVLAANGEEMHFSKSDCRPDGIFVSDGVKTALVDVGELCRNDYPDKFINLAKKALKEEYRKGALNGVGGG